MKTIKSSGEKGEHLFECLLPSVKDIRGVLCIDIEELPPLPAAITKLLQLSGDEKYSLDQLTAIIETDPSLAVKMLRVVNSPAYGLSEKTANVKEAVLILGFLSVKALALETTFFDYVKGGAENINGLFFWRHCLTVAHLSKHLAEAVGHRSPDDVYTAGLLHDIGKIILDRYGKISYGDFIRARCGYSGLLIEEEADIIGMGHDDVGAYFYHKWDIPNIITCSAKFHHKPFAHMGLPHDEALLIACVSLADFLTWSQGMGSVNIARQPLMQKEVDDLIEPSRIDLNSMVLKTNREVKSVADFYGFYFPTSEALRANLIRANLHLGKIITGYYVHEKEFKSDKVALPNIGKSLVVPRQSLDSKEIISSTIDTIQMDFGFDRVCLLEITGPGRNLAVSYMRCPGGSGTPLDGLRINVTSRLKGFMECLRTRLPVITEGRSEEEKQLLKTLSLTELGLVTVVCDKHVSGIIAVDNAQTGRPLHLSELSDLVFIAQELGTALEHAKIVENYRLRANTDHLTGIFNRAAVDELLENAFNAAKTGATQLSVGMIDIDHFKKFNDAFGHLAGDSVLRLVASALEKSSRPGDLTGRYGGEEFIVILTNTGYEDAFHFAKRLVRVIEKLGITLAKRFKGAPLTISIGVASLTSTMESKEELIKEADKALYRAKDLGRNRVEGSQGIAM